jgi:hypothetical protein
MGNPFGENRVTTVVQGATLPALVRTLKDENNVVVTLSAVVDSVAFRLVDKQTGQIVVNNGAAEITDGPNGVVTYNWQAGNTDRVGFYDEQWKVTFGSGGVLYVKTPAPLTIRPLDDSRFIRKGWIFPLGQAKAYLGSRTSEDDLQIANHVAAVSAMISSWLGYDLADATYTHDGATLAKLDGSGRVTMYLDARPVTSISALTIEGMLNPPITDPCIFAWYPSGEMTFKSGGWMFPLGRQNIGVTYRAGYTVYDGSTDLFVPTMPQAIIAVGFEVMRRKMTDWQRKGPQVISASLPQGGGSVTYAPSELTKEQKMMLSPYRAISALPSAMVASRW